MEYSLLEEEYEIEILWQKVTFQSPTIRNFLVVEKKLKTSNLIEIVEALDILLPWNDFNEAQKLIHSADIIKKVFDKVFPNTKLTKSNDEWFFPSIIEYLCPNADRQIEYMKNTTMNQMLTQSAAKERNMNLQNGKPHKNKSILYRQLDNSYIESAKDRIRLKFNSIKNEQ